MQEKVEIQDIPDVLKKRWGITISYSGLRHYINTGLIPKPTKFENRKEKYYDPEDVAQYLMGIKYCSSFFRLSHAKLNKIISTDRNINILTSLPGFFMMLCGESMRETEKSLGHFGFNNMSPVEIDKAGEIFLKAVEEAMKKLKKSGGLLHSHAVYMEIRKVFLSKNKEAREKWNYEKIREYLE